MSLCVLWLVFLPTLYDHDASNSKLLYLSFLIRVYLPCLPRITIFGRLSSLTFFLDIFRHVVAIVDCCISGLPLKYLINTNIILVPFDMKELVAKQMHMCLSPCGLHARLRENLDE